MDTNQENFEQQILFSKCKPKNAQHEDKKNKKISPKDEYTTLKDLG